MKIERKSKHSDTSQSHDVDTSRRETLQRLAGGTAAALMLAACGGGGGDAENVGLADPANPAAAPVGTVLPAPGTRDVVVGGFVGNKDSYLGKLWGTGGEKSVTGDKREEESRIISVAFGPQGIAAVGSYAVSNFLQPSSTTPRRASVWFNGEARQTLSPSVENSKAAGVFFVGNDIYVAGTIFLPADNLLGIKSRAVYWKNGEPIFLTPGVTSIEESTGIFVQNGDVYVSGTVEAGSRAAYWKNGIKILLSNKLSQATAITVKDADVYVVGFIEGSGAVLWKNGVPTAFTNKNATNYTIYSGAEAVSIGPNNDVYVVGGGGAVGAGASSSTSRAYLLKNGVEQELEMAQIGSTGQAVAVIGNDVYVAGNLLSGTTGSQGDTIAALWVNGKIQLLSDGKDYAIATSVAVR